ncbi:hypothetical protein [Nostoc sp. T09]|uniref:hypothetical protein n=1 Tax=Nostoc sp. T09 TaxID=1932621 RepID=UPI00211AC1B5|nr:hypothetical protein [Nostoc sp. T09]
MNEFRIDILINIPPSRIITPISCNILALVLLALLFILGDLVFLYKEITKTNKYMHSTIKKEFFPNTPERKPPKKSVVQTPKKRYMQPNPAIGNELRLKRLSNKYKSCLCVKNKVLLAEISAIALANMGSVIFTLPIVVGSNTNG